MRFKVTAPIRNWYSIEASPGETIELEGVMAKKAEGVDFLEAVKRGRPKKEDDDKDVS